MIGAPVSWESLTFYGSSSYKPMLYQALAGLPFSFRTANLKNGVQSTPDYLGGVAVQSSGLGSGPAGLSSR